MTRSGINGQGWTLWTEMDGLDEKRRTKKSIVHIVHTRPLSIPDHKG
jgi:hypothetical protein